MCLFTGRSKDDDTDCSLNRLVWILGQFLTSFYNMEGILVCRTICRYSCLQNKISQKLSLIVLRQNQCWLALPSAVSSCSSRTKNMMWYGVLGTKELVQKTYKNLEQRVQLEVRHTREWNLFQKAKFCWLVSTNVLCSSLCLSSVWRCSHVSAESAGLGCAQHTELCRWYQLLGRHQGG